MKRGDVFAVSWQGGGGFGDPLDRDPSAVAADLQRGLISGETASSIYGVVLAHGRVDAVATDRASRRHAATARR